MVVAIAIVNSALHASFFTFAVVQGESEKITDFLKSFHNGWAF